MAIKRFGYTWWGKEWLNALSRVDYSNRLPRGQRYARNGSVESININRNIIQAKVRGSRLYRVNVDIPVFNQKQKKKIKEIIETNSFYLSQLSSQKLPEQILNDMGTHNIKLFPEKWSDFKMNCSCPDWANPCKHLAAVIYLVANEIDKNPFIVFNLKGYELLDDLTYVINEDAFSVNSDDILELSKILEDAGKKETKVIDDSKFFEKAKKIDFSCLPNLTDDILKVLSENPLFSLECDYKKLLAKMYKINTSNITKIFVGQEKQDFNEFKKIEIKQIVINEDFSELDIKCSANCNDLDFWINFVNSVDFSELQHYSNNICFLWLCFTFAIRLLKTGSYIPQLIKIDKKKYLLRYIPALFNETISNTFESIVCLMPDKLVKVEKKKGNICPVKKEATLIIISFFFNQFIKKYNEKLDFQGDIKIFKFFFSDFTFKIKDFEDTQIPQTIHLWLSRFYLVHNEIFPVIKISEKEKGNKFLFEILVDNQKEQKEKALELEDVLTNKKYKEIRMQVLKDLSILSEYLPIVNDYLAEKAEKPLEIDSDSFVPVWFDSLPILNILGIKTILPKALNKIINPKIALSAKEGSSATINSYLDLSEMLSFDWKISIGDQFIAASEFFEYVENLSGIVRFKDQYVLIDQKEISKLLKSYNKETPNLSSMDILRINLQEEYDNIPIEVSQRFKDKFTQFFKVEKIKIAKKLNAKLRHYQQRGYEWLYHNIKFGFGSVLADDMGLGKTIQMITILLKLKEEKMSNDPSLIIVPTTLLTNWEHECNKFAKSLKISIYHGYERKLDTNCDVVFTTYGVIRSEITKFKQKKWNLIILDEAQNIKNHTTKQTKAIKSLVGNIRIAMTGTPIENGLLEYWSIMDFVNKGLFGNFTSFTKEFAVPIEKYRDKEKLNKFLKISAPFLLRRVKTDKKIIDDLPEKNQIDEYCNLTKEQAALYQNVVKQTMDLIQNTEESGIQRKGFVFKLIMSLKQICNHPVNFLKKGEEEITVSDKAMVLKEILKKIFAINEKCVIFTQYKEMGTLLQKMFSKEFDTEILFLHGGSTRKKRDEMVYEFQNNPEIKIFILSLKAGGTGLNLTAASHVFHYDLWWNPAVEAQATDRAYRIGQKKNVNVYRFITKGTFEEKINDILNSKKELFDLSIKSGETWISKLSNKELKTLVSLDG